MAYTLSLQQIAYFKENGFLVVRAAEHGLFKVQELQEWTTTVQSWPKGSGKGMPYDEINIKGERQLMRTENFTDEHEQFRELLCGQTLTSILRQLSGNEMILFKDKINYKQAFGNGFGAHLDAPAYDHICKVEHLTANIAVDAATLENGCLEVVPGSHQMQVELSYGGAITEKWEAEHEWQPVLLNPGDVLFFGSHLAHRSEKNQTNRPRASVYATYSGAEDGQDLRLKYYADRKIEFPPDHERLPDRDYTRGWERYGFAAPFAKEEQHSPVAT